MDIIFNVTQYNLPPKNQLCTVQINYSKGSCYRCTCKEKDVATHTDARQNWPFPAVTNNCSHLAGKRTAPCGSLPALSLHQTLIISKTLWLRSHRGKLIPADTNMAWAVMLSTCYFFPSLLFCINGAALCTHSLAWCCLLSLSVCFQNAT